MTIPKDRIVKAAAPERKRKRVRRIQDGEGWLYSREDVERNWPSEFRAKAKGDARKDKKVQAKTGK